MKPVACRKPDANGKRDQGSRYQDRGQRAATKQRILADSRGPVLDP